MNRKPRFTAVLALSMSIAFAIIIANLIGVFQVSAVSKAASSKSSDLGSQIASYPNIVISKILPYSADAGYSSENAISNAQQDKKIDISLKNQTETSENDTFDSTAYIDRLAKQTSNLTAHISEDIPNSERVVVLTFDDGPKSQFNYAKPILDEFGFKATFFVICNYAEGAAHTYVDQGEKEQYMTWNDIMTLKSEGHDIESHSMNHRVLLGLSQKDLDFEIGQSQQCLSTHGINATVFATPYNLGWNDSSVVDTIAKYYAMAKDGNSPLMYMHCDGWGRRVTNQSDCRTYDEQNDSSKIPNFANRYSIKAWSNNFYDKIFHHDQKEIFDQFVKEINYAMQNNEAKGKLDSFPVLQYHKVDEITDDLTTTPGLFYAEMKFLHDNGFIVLTMADLKYNEEGNYIQVKTP